MELTLGVREEEDQGKASTLLALAMGSWSPGPPWAGSAASLPSTEVEPCVQPGERWPPRLSLSLEFELKKSEGG